MRRKIKKMRCRQDGSILVLVAVALVALASLGMGMLQIAYGVRHKAIRLSGTFDLF